MLQKLYPFRSEQISAGGVRIEAFVYMAALVAMSVWTVYLFWRPLSLWFGVRKVGAESVVVVGAGAVGTPVRVSAADVVRVESQELMVTPTAFVMVLVTNTPENTYPTATPELVTGTAVGLDDMLPVGYERNRIVGRFSNYWPANGGINAAGEAQLFADGTRVDQALAEGWRVVACPVELLLGTRIEWPPGTGLVWTCRDRGAMVTMYYGENGLPIYWFDFLVKDAWVDYGSYIQVDLFVPVR